MVWELGMVKRQYQTNNDEWFTGQEIAQHIIWVYVLVSRNLFAWLKTMVASSLPNMIKLLLSFSNFPWHDDLSQYWHHTNIPHFSCSFFSINMLFQIMWENGNLLYIYINIFNSLYKYLQFKIGSTKNSIPNVFVHLCLDKCLAHLLSWMVYHMVYVMAFMVRPMCNTWYLIMKYCGPYSN